MALSIGANTFAFFTRNPRGGSVRQLDLDDVAALRSLMAEHSFGPLVKTCAVWRHCRAIIIISILEPMWARASSAVSSSLPIRCAR